MKLFKEFLPQQSMKRPLAGIRPDCQANPVSAMGKFMQIAHGNTDGIVKSQNRHLHSTELQGDTTFPPSVSWLFTTPTILATAIQRDNIAHATKLHRPNDY